MKRLRQQLKQDSLDLFLTDNPANRRYLTGFNGSDGWLVVETDKATLLVDSRYTLQASREVPSEVEVVEIRSFLTDFWSDLSKKFPKASVGFEPQHLTHSQLLKLKKRSRGLKLVPTENLVEGLRAVKEPGEIDLIRKAVRIADLALEYIRGVIRPGLTEREISWEVEKFCREHGAEKMAWEPVIVASGENGALPHHKVSDRKIREKEPILFDFGTVVEGYHSDVSRVFFVGGVDRKQKEVYEAVLAGQNLARGLIRRGINGGEIDRKVKDFLNQKSSGVYTHALGHGLGLGVHELPVLTQGKEVTLQSGNVITLEPGIYLEGWGGVRIEDAVLVTNSGCETLTSFPKEIEKVVV